MLELNSYAVRTCIRCTSNQLLMALKLGNSAALQALSHTARAAVLACRTSSQWHELMHSLQHLWNAGQALLHNHEQLTSACGSCTWAVAPLPQPRVPPLGLEGLTVAARPASSAGGAGPGAGVKGKAAAGAKAASSNIGAADKKGVPGKAGKGAGGAVAASEPQMPVRQILQPQNVGQRVPESLRCACGLASLIPAGIAAIAA
jgi:hypothetical protein